MHCNGNVGFIFVLFSISSPARSRFKMWLDYIPLLCEADVLSFRVKSKSY